jgi:hypothetical protein
MKPLLIAAQPLNVPANARQVVRIGDSPVAEGYGLGNANWEPAVAQRPTLSIELMSPDMDGKVQAGQARFSLLLSQLQTAGDLTKLYWQGAPVTISTAAELSLNRAVTEFVGSISTARPDLETGVLTLEATASMTGEFTGGGGILGEAASRGTLWPAGFGANEYIEPVWFDTINNIGMIDGYGNTLTIDRLMEGASDMGARVADYADYNALKAAIVAKVIKPGQWGSCVAQGLVGLGAPPAGKIGVNATFGGGKPGSLCRRLLEVHAAIPAGSIDTAAFDALTAQVEALLGRAAPVHYWLSQQREVKDLLEAMAASCNATPIVTFQGKVSITRAVVGASVATLDRSGATDPRVLNWKKGDIQPPFYKLKARTARPATVLSRDQVNFIDDFVPMGVYDVTTVYRAGNTVFKTDGSEWLYINATAAAGQAMPATAYPPAALAANAYWQQIQPGTAYADGTSIEALKPAQAGADKTSLNSSLYLIGEGTLARKNEVTVGTGDIKDSAGNPIPPVRIFDQLLDLSTFYPGASTTAAGKTPAQLRDTFGGGMSSIVLAAVPGFGAEILWKAVTAAGGAAYQGGMNASPGAEAGFDPRKTYRFLLWVHEDVGDNAILYAGPGASVRRLTDGSINANPYFGPGEVNFSLPVKGKRYLLVGIVHGSSYAGASTGQSGLYDPDTGKNVSVGTEYKWDAAATDIGFRSFRYFGTVGKATYWGRPVVEEVSANSLSIQQLMATVGATAGTSLFRSDGTTPLAQAEIRTIEGTALFLSGEGTLARKNAVDLATSEVLNKSLATVDLTASNKLGGIAAGATVGSRAGTNLYRSDGTTVLSQAEVRTIEGTALFLSGEGALARVNAADFDTQVTGGNKPGAAVGRILDTRNANSLPSVYYALGSLGIGNRTEFKDGAVIDAPGGQTGYFTLETKIQWSDSSGGPITQIARNGAGEWRRYSTGTGTWGAWQKSYDQQNKPGFHTSDLIDSVGAVVQAAYRTIEGTSLFLSGEGVLARRNDVLLDTHVVDGSTYKRYAATEQTKLGGIAAGATVGSRAGTNFYRSDGVTVMTQAEVRTIEGTALFLSGEGTLARKNAVDLATSEVLNKSLANVDATANTKLGGIAAGATVGARSGTNLYRSDGATVLSQAEVRTIEGTALFLSGEGTLARKNAVDFSAEITGKPVARFYVNLLDLTGWKTGGSVTTGQFVDTSGQSSLVTMVGPSGLPETVWKCVADAGGGAFDGGWNDAVFDAEDGFDPTKSYLYLVWVMRPAGFTNAFAYFGPRTFATAKVQTLANVDDANPYFVSGNYPSGNSAVGDGKWFLWVGVTHGSGYTGGDSGTAGIYDPDTGTRLFAGTEFKNKAGATDNAHRIFAYPGTPGNTMYFARPAVREFVAGEVSIWNDLADVRKTSKLANTGRVVDPTFYNTQALLGPSNTTNLSPTYTVGGSNVTVNLPAHTRKVTGAAGPVSLSYGAVSGVVAFSAYWTAYVDDPALTGLASPVATFTSNPDDLLYPGRYQIASGIAPAAGGGGGSTGGGGGSGGGGFDNCVAAYAWVETRDRGWLLAQHIVAGDWLRVLEFGPDGRAIGTTWAECHQNFLARAQGVRLRSSSGHELDLADTTPITLLDGTVILAPDAAGHLIPLFRQDVCEEDVTVERIGELEVAHISCHDGNYLAGNVAGMGIFSHNIIQKP